MTHIRILSVCLLAGLVLGPAPARALDARVLDSVVRLKPDWPLAQRGLDAQGAPRDPQGTGIAVIAGGYIATNVHVVGEAKAVEVLLEDGRHLPAAVIGRDPTTDIALLKVDVDLPLLPLADVPLLAAPVCAIGNQFGLGLSVTCGVVSARSRAGVGFNPVEDFIQTDAAINPGGSGGALVDADGHLVGMVAAIFTKQSDADIGVNFATSTRLLMRVVDDLRQHGGVIRGNPGFTAAEVPPGLSKVSGGALVKKVDPAGPAFAAGLDAGDIVTHVDGARLAGLAAFETAMFMHRPGDSVDLQTRRGSAIRNFSLTLRPH